jgi:hypothetical protein
MERRAALVGLLAGFAGRLLLPYGPALPSAGSVTLVIISLLAVPTLLVVLLTKVVRANTELPKEINAVLLWERFKARDTSLSIKSFIFTLVGLLLLLTFVACFIGGFFATHALLRSSNA